MTNKINNGAAGVNNGVKNFIIFDVLLPLSGIIEDFKLKVDTPLENTNSGFS